MSDITILKRNDQKDEDKGIESQLKEEYLREQIRKAREFFATFQQNEFDGIEGDFKEGLSYLDMKNDTLLSYMIDLCNIMQRRVRKQSIEHHSSVERCVTYRVILEKMKMIDQRLAYQLNKLISLPEGSSAEEQGIDINNLDVDIGSDDDDDEDKESVDADQDVKDDQSDDLTEQSVSEDDEGSDAEVSADDGSKDDEGATDENQDDELKERLMRKQIIANKGKKNKKDISSSSNAGGVYKPPKLRSVAYDGDSGRPDRGERRKDYNDFYQDDDNFDIVEETRAVRDEERVRYEEDNYTRLRDENPKKLKRKARIKSTGGKGKKKFKGKKNKW